MIDCASNPEGTASLWAWLGNQPPVLAAGILLAAAFPCCIVIATARRLLAGASPWTLIAQRGYEVTCLRAGLRLIFFGLVTLALVGLAAAATSGVALYKQWASGKALDHQGLWIVATGTAALVVGSLLARAFHRSILSRRVSKGPLVDTRVANIRRGLDRSTLSTLGAERFPNHIHPRWRSSLVARSGLLAFHLVLAAALGWVAAREEAHCKAAPYLDHLATWLQHGVDWVRRFDIPESLGLLGCWISSICLLVLTGTNGSYTHFPFFRSQLATLLLEGLLFVSAATCKDTLMLRAIAALSAIAATAVLLRMEPRPGTCSQISRCGTNSAADP